MTDAKRSDKPVLRDVDEAMRRVWREKSWSREALVADRAWGEAKKAAVVAFAALNGWKSPSSSYWHPDAIGRRNRRFLDGDLELPAVVRFFDHCIGFRADGKNVAVVTQPYDCGQLDGLKRWAAARGLALHVPSDPLASIHYPGATFFIVITKAGGAMRWLPEQDGRLKALWSARRAKAAE